MSTHWLSLDYSYQLVPRAPLPAGDSRGPVLETIVSRVNFIVAQTGVPVRLIGLSTALANARDLADWLNVGASVCAAASAPVTTSGASASPMAAVGAGANALSQLLGSAGAGFLFNFHPSVRPVTLEVHIAGFAGKNYCPRMATMNKPCYLGTYEHNHTRIPVHTYTVLVHRSYAYCAPCVRV